MIPKAKPGGRPREVDMWEILNAIFYVLVEGVRWRSHQAIFRPGKRYTPTFAPGAKTKQLQLHDRLRDWTRIEQERHQSPSEASTVKVSRSAAMVSQSVGYDAGKHIKDASGF